jgi:hypothetical protein
MKYMKLLEPEGVKARLMEEYNLLYDYELETLLGISATAAKNAFSGEKIWPTTVQAIATKLGVKPRSIAQEAK